MRKPAVQSLSLQVNRFSRNLVLSEAIRSCLDLDILPSRKAFPRRFAKTDIVGDRYYAGRVHLDPQLSDDDYTVESYERLIQTLFWKGAMNFDSTTHEPELYVTGAVGSGKSTFVDFYLRYYCPEVGDWKDEFEKKLVVYFDARGLESQSYASNAFYDQLLKAIEVHCKSHNLPIPPSRDSVKRSQDALRVLSDYCKSPQYFRYLVLVLDNLDNCTVAVQRQVIQYVNDIRKYTDIVLWRVVIPLWPTTYSTFSQSTEALTTGKPRIHLGPPRELEFIKQRLSVIKDRLIQETRLQLAPGASSSNISPETGAEFADYVDFVFDQIRDGNIGSLIRRLSGDDLRRELWLWEGLLRSAASERIYDDRKEHPTRKYEYEWLEALLAGDSRSRPDGDRRIANLFSMHQDHITARDLLAGIHGCYLLQGRRHRRDWYADMVRLGYNEDHVNGLEQTFRLHNMLHPVPEKFSGENFEVHDRVVEAYVELCVQEAYVDNVSMTTPVDEGVVKQIVQTSGHIGGDVVNRINSSIAFIEFIMEQEIAFVNEFKARYSSTAGEQVTQWRWLDSKKIPGVAYRMAKKYLDRVNAIRELIASDKVAWWQQCERRLSEVVDATRDTLL